jgi:hypothetical protein
MIIKVFADLLKELFASLCKHWRGVSCYVAGVLTVVLLAIWCDKPVHTHSTAIQHVYDTIRTIDTITSQTPLAVVKRYIVHDTTIITIHDTLHIVTVDTLGCLSGSYVADDSASFEWQACSEDFPKSLSDKIFWDVKYLPAPRITETITITDTVTTSNTWNTIKTGAFWGVIGACVGIVGGVILGAK